MRKATRNWSCLLIVVLISVFVASLLVGKQVLHLHDLRAIFTKEASRAQQLIFWEFRLPRSLIALIGGSGLAIAGFLLQGVTRNELADASILGINSGAGLLVMLYLGFFPQGNSFLLPLVGFAGGLLAATIIYLIAYSKDSLSLEKVLLAGIAVNAGLSAMTLLLTIQIAKDSYKFVASWLAGSIWGTTWSSVLTLAPIVLFLALLAFWRVPILNLLGFGKAQAVSLGVKVDRERLFLLMIAVALAASCVAFTGNLAFVGLLAPHMAKELLKRESRQSLAVAAVIGATLVLIADTIGRVVLASGEIPAGILIALIGAPYFLYLMLKNKL